MTGEILEHEENMALYNFAQEVVLGILRNLNSKLRKFSSSESNPITPSNCPDLQSHQERKGRSIQNVTPK